MPFLILLNYYRKTELETSCQEVKAAQKDLDDKLDRLKDELAARKKEKNKLVAEKEQRVSRASAKCDEIKRKQVKELVFFSYLMQRNNPLALQGDFEIAIDAVRAYAEENNERKMEDKKEAHKKAQNRKQGTEAEYER